MGCTHLLFSKAFNQYNVPDLWWYPMPKRSVFPSTGQRKPAPFKMNYKSKNLNIYYKKVKMIKIQSFISRNVVALELIILIFF